MIEKIGGCTRTRTLDPLIKSQRQPKQSRHSFQLKTSVKRAETRQSWKALTLRFGAVREHLGAISYHAAGLIGPRRSRPGSQRTAPGSSSNRNCAATPAAPVVRIASADPQKEQWHGVRKMPHPVCFTVQPLPSSPGSIAATSSCNPWPSSTATAFEIHNGRSTLRRRERLFMPLSGPSLPTTLPDP